MTVDASSEGAGSPPPFVQSATQYQRWGTLTLLLSMVIGPVFAERSATIDLSPALVVGDYTVPVYTAQKYFRRFANSHVPIDTAARQSWIRRFRAEQLVIGRAKALGYFERPEVVSVVDAMAQAMLSQRLGPYFQQRFKEAPSTQVPLARLYEWQFEPLAGWVARFSDAKTAGRLLGTDFASQSAEVQSARVKSCEHLTGAEVRFGAFVWPYGPFLDVHDVLGALAEARTVRHEEPGGEVYWVHLSRQSQDLPRPPTADMARFSTSVKQITEDAIFEATRRRVVRDASLSISPSGAERLMRVLGVAEYSQSLIPDRVINEIKDAPLFSFHAGTDVSVVSIREYCRSANRRFVRRIPRTLAELREDIETYVVGESIAARAKREHLDQSPQFLADRAGFLAYEALELFKRERLLPQLSVKAEDLRRYYESHLQDYRRPAYTNATLLTFASWDEAVAYRRTGKFENGHAPTEQQRLRLTPDQPISGLGIPMLVLMQEPAGTQHGPVRRGKKSVVVLLNGTHFEQRPLDEVESEVRECVTRLRLDDAVQEFGRKLSMTEAVEDYLERSIPGAASDSTAAGVAKATGPLSGD